MGSLTYRTLAFIYAPIKLKSFPHPKVTWNDYLCHCKEGYKGADCDELEYCHW